MNRYQVLKSEADSMTAAIAEMDAKIAQATAQRDSLAILLEAVCEAIRRISPAADSDEQLELPLFDQPNNEIEFPTVLGTN
jgi:hypothetical protein